MHKKKINNSLTKNFIQGLRPLSNTLPTQIKKVLKKNGFNLSSIVDNWTKIVNKKITFLSLYLFAVVSTPLFNNYDLTFFISPLREISPEIIKYTKNLDNWGYSVSNNGNQDIEFCWINKNCLPPSKYKILEDNLNNYRLIYVEK